MSMACYITMNIRSIVSIPYIISMIYQNLYNDTYIMIIYCLLIFDDSQVMVVGKAHLENLSLTVQRGSWSISLELGAEFFKFQFSRGCAVQNVATNGEQNAVDKTNSMFEKAAQTFMSPVQMSSKCSMRPWHICWEDLRRILHRYKSGGELFDDSMHRAAKLQLLPAIETGRVRIDT